MSKLKTDHYRHISDSELLDLYARDQNPEWIGILLERYTLLLLGVCMKYLKDENDARDSVQQVFLKVLTDISKYNIVFFKSWLYIVAKNHCLMQIREKKKGTKVLTEELIVADNGMDMKDLAAIDKTHYLLEESINELNTEQRQCVILFYLKKQSYQQISQITGFQIMQVKSYIQNGKRNLKNILEGKIKKSI